uniref:BTB domain-containing protein n=1 Tax=Panagrolaimus sp. ES5 TaxID=591445 RepID=A0AC34FU25_9BILA
MQEKRFKIFESQHLENGRFDVTFEIDGKMLHAHKFILTSVSETMDTWLTDLWTTKDEPVKITNYCYDDFYEFLRFLYIGDCKLNDENIFQMVDVAEFYGVPNLKELCHEYLEYYSGVVITSENMEEMCEFSQKYSLPGFEIDIINYVYNHGERILNNTNFLNFKKSFVELVCENIHHKYQEKTVEAVCDLVQKQILLNQKSPDDNFNIDIKAVFSTIIPKIKFYKMDKQFLKNCVVANGILSQEQANRVNETHG